MPLVSVVLPTYNRAGTLRRAIHSVLSQTFRDLELIVVDDASTDATAQLIAGIDDPRLRYVKLDRNGGPSRARNAGVEAARGELIAYQDSDDEWLGEKLERQVAAMQSRPGVSLVTCGCFLPGEPGRSLIGMDTPEPVVDITRQVYWHLVSCQCWLTRKDALTRAGGWNAALDCWEDWELGVRLSDVGSVLMVNAVLVVKATTPGSLFDDRRFSRNLQQILTLHQARLAPHPAVRARFCNLIAQSEGVHGSMAEARRWYRQSLAIKPLGVRALASLAMTYLGRGLFTRFVSAARNFRTRFPGPARPPLVQA